jgi:hypothetical protein
LILVLGIIVSSNFEQCRWYLQDNKLNPKDYKYVTEVEPLMGMKRDTPIIITYHRKSPKFDDMINYILARFTNVIFQGY